jgi:GNAT superfamily N-acetyltransferase
MTKRPPNRVTYRFDKDFDLQEWLDLYRSCGWYPSSTVEDLRVIREHAYVVVTAWVSSNLAGTLTILSDGRNYGTIDDLVVRPEHQRSGIGSALVRLAVGHLEGIDSSVIKLVAIPGVEPFYERLGFRATGETVMSLGQ